MFTDLKNTNIYFRSTIILFSFLFSVQAYGEHDYYSGQLAAFGQTRQQPQQSRCALVDKSQITNQVQVFIDQIIKQIEEHRILMRQKEYAESMMEYERVGGGGLSAREANKLSEDIRLGEGAKIAEGHRVPYNCQAENNADIVIDHIENNACQIHLLEACKQSAEVQEIDSGTPDTAKVMAHLKSERMRVAGLRINCERAIKESILSESCQNAYEEGFARLYEADGGTSRSEQMTYTCTEKDMNGVFKEKIVSAMQEVTHLTCGAMGSLLDLQKSERIVYNREQYVNAVGRCLYGKSESGEDCADLERMRANEVTKRNQAELRGIYQASQAGELPHSKPVGGLLQSKPAGGLSQSRPVGSFPQLQQSQRLPSSQSSSFSN